MSGLRFDRHESAEAWVTWSVGFGYLARVIRAGVLGVGEKIEIHSAMLGRKRQRSI